MANRNIKFYPPPSSATPNMPTEDQNPAFSSLYNLSPPPLLPGTTGDNSAIAVNTDAMRDFAKNLYALADDPGLNGLLTDLPAATITPGGFPTAYNLMHKINDTGTGILDQVTQTVTNVISALNEVAQGITSMANKYDTVEAQNKLSVSDLGQFFQSASGTVGSMLGSNGSGGGSAGGGSSSGASGSSGGGSGGSGSSGSGSGGSSGGSGSSSS